VELAQRVGAARSHTADWRVRAALDLARVLAHVDEHDPLHPMQAAGWKKFAGTRRETEAGEDRPLLSEARFRRLLETGDGEEKVAAFTRLIALMGNRINVQRLANAFLDWNHPTRGDRVREQWAFNYFHAYDAAPPALTPSPEDDDA
jgi:CRISPR type I-E-associated protein CasB/Cse2